MEQPETFESFKNSFSYGDRSDLNFKFLKQLTEAEAGAFFQELLHTAGDFFNDGDGSPIARTVMRWQALAYGRSLHWTYDDGPFTPLPAPLQDLRLALFTSSGHFAAGDDPQPFGVEGMAQAEAEARIGDFIRSEAQLSEIPADTPPQDLRVRHGGYDVRAALQDPNTVFPLELLREMAAEGRFDLHGTAFSFVGATAQTPLIKKSAPAWAGMFKEARVDAVLLVPV